MKALKYTEPNTAIHCPTQGEAKRVCEMLADAGNGMARKLLDRWDLYNGETSFCIDPALGEWGVDKDYIRNGYTVIPAAEFIAANTKATNLEGVQVGDRLWHILRQAWGTVLSMDTPPWTTEYVLEWQGDDMRDHYTIDGRDDEGDMVPVLYFAPITNLSDPYPPRPVPVWEPKEWELIWVRDEGTAWAPRLHIFRKMQEGKYLDDSGSTWNYAAPFDKQNPVPPSTPPGE